MTRVLRRTVIPAVALVLNVGCGASDRGFQSNESTPTPPPAGAGGTWTAPPPFGAGGGTTTPPPFGTGGTTATPPALGAGGGTVPPVEPPIDTNECGLDTGFLGDERCILPPPPDQGFQVHIGPTDYDNPDDIYVLQPGDESTTDFPVVSPNQEDRFFYYRQYRMRPTAHHMIITVNDSGSTLPFIGAIGRRIATANLSHDFPAGGVIAPENQGVGSPLAPRSSLNVSLHAINVGATPQLREIWVNFWYRDPAVVTEPAVPWFKLGSTSFAVAPQQDVVLGPYSCTVPSAGRMLWFYGHRHANNVRFTASRVRGAARDVIYEGYDWEEPLMLEYSSQVQNSLPDPVSGKEGGWSGVLDLLPGDRIEWDCHVVNKQNTTLRFTNETYLGEMCILDAEAVGTGCTGF